MEHLKRNKIPRIILYDYQRKAYKKLIDSLIKTNRALMVLATGLGKTILSIMLVKYFFTEKQRVLFLCHDNGILNKSFNDYKKFMGNHYSYAKFYGQEKNRI